jgi:hypothetical protein
LFPPPALNINFSSGNNMITWPTNSPAGFVLQVSTNLVSSNWTTITNGVVTTNGEYQVTVPPTNGPASFYRLKM